MGIIASGEALLSSAVDGIVHPISTDDLDWEIIGTDDRQMGMETLHQAEFEHPELGRLAWTISEYPVEFLNFVTHEMNGHLLLEDFDFSIEHEPDTDDLLHMRSAPVAINIDELEQAGFDSQKDMLIAWFVSRYQDPAHETPYDGREGGYQYIHGGPYEAREELGSEFGSYVSDEVIEAAADEIESDGTTEWAPIRHFDDREDEYEFEPRWIADFRVVINDPERIEPTTPETEDARNRVHRHAEEFLQALRETRPGHGQIGHNGPPTDDKGRVLPPDFYEELEAAGERILRAFENVNPPLGRVVDDGAILEKRLSWIAPPEIPTKDNGNTGPSEQKGAKKLAKFTDAFQEQAGKNSADMAFGVGRTVAIVGGGFVLEMLVPGLSQLVGSILIYLGLRTK